MAEGLIVEVMVNRRPFPWTGHVDIKDPTQFSAWALFQDRYPVGQQDGLVHVVSNENYCSLLFRTDPFDLILKLGPRQRV